VDVPVRITAYRDGPLLVRGEVVLTDETGAVLDAGRTPMALCRCGKSRLRPFCDGQHKAAAFSAPCRPPQPPREPAAS
jgi:CDGSH-type Zn-finger protein